jgi:hypothetical protein
MTNLGFLVFYVLALPLTYILPYFGSNSLFAHGLTSAAFRGQSTTFMMIWTVLHLACYGVMIWAAVMRGPYINKKTLWAFPVLALAFDFIPLISSIPLVPTVFHVIALVTAINAVEVD